MSLCLISFSFIFVASNECLAKLFVFTLYCAVMYNANGDLELIAIMQIYSGF